MLQLRRGDGKINSIKIIDQNSDAEQNADAPSQPAGPSGRCDFRLNLFHLVEPALAEQSLAIDVMMRFLAT